MCSSLHWDRIFTSGIRMTLCGKLIKLDRDKGYAWVILGLSFLSHIMHIGFNYAVIGVLTIAHQEHFNITLSQSSLISSVHIAALFLTAPIASVLVKKIGCRWTTITGGILIIVSFNTSYLSTEPWHAVLLFGILCAAGISNTYIASTEVISQYFSKYKYFAFSTVVMGCYIGLIIWPIVSQKLVDVYGYSKAMSLLSIPHAYHLIAGALFFDQPYNRENLEDLPNEGTSAKFNDELKTSMLALDQSSSAVFSEDCEEASENVSLTLEHVEIKAILHQSDSILSQKLNEEESFAVGDDERNDAPPTEDRENKTSLCQSFICLLKDPKVWALLANAIFWAGNVTSYFVLASDYIIRRNNLTDEEAAKGVTITGAGTMIGCLSVIALSMTRVDRVVTHVFTLLIIGGSTIAMAFSNGKVMFYLLAGIWGYGSGSFNSNLVPAVSTFCPQSNLVLLLSLHLFAESISALSAPPFVVFISNKTTNQLGMVTAGCFGLCSCLYMLPVIVSNTRKKMREPEKYGGFCSALLTSKETSTKINN